MEIEGTKSVKQESRGFSHERFNTAPKVFADYRRFIKDEHNNSKLDENYDYRVEIQKQIALLEQNSS